MQISGFGKAKAEKYGDEILEAVESFCERHGLETNMDAKSGSPKKERKSKSTNLKQIQKPFLSGYIKPEKILQPLLKKEIYLPAPLMGTWLFLWVQGKLILTTWLLKKNKN